MSGWLLLLACSRPPDPRPTILATFPKDAQAVHPPDVALREERPGEACRGYQRLLLDGGDETAWAGILTTSARSACLPTPDGDALATWGASRDPGLWAGPRAEWLAFRGDVDGARALLPKASADARMRVALRLHDGDAMRDAAESVLVESPGNLMACRQLVNQSLEVGDLFRAAEEAECHGVQSPDLARVKGIVLDRAGEYDQAEQIFRDTRSYVHLASLLYQRNPTPERLEEARRLLEGDGMPPARLHQAWMSLLGMGEPPPLQELRGNPDLRLVAAALLMDQLAQPDLEDLANAPGAGPLIMQARVAAVQGKKGLALSALEQAHQREPYFEPVLRGAVGILIQLKEDPGPWLDRWKGLDPDHIRLRGTRDRREVVWDALVPWTWATLVKQNPSLPAEIPLATGHDEVGDAWRTALAVPERGACLDILQGIQQKNSDLLELSSIRYRLEAGLIPDLKSVTEPSVSHDIPHSASPIP